MGDNKGESTTKKHLSSSSPKDPLDQESTETKPPPQHHRHHSPTTVSPPFISTPLYVPTSSPNFDPQQQQFEPAVNPKRPRYTSAQWKPLPSPSSQQPKHPQITTLITTEPPHTTAASSSETASSPSHSPSPSSSKPEATGDHQLQHQLRKGKYVSPVWKPNEMLWLARAWKAQYQGGDAEGAAQPSGGDAAAGTQPSRGKTRAEKDREVAEFLNRHGVSRDAKTAGTKWDNMLGEFRKVFEWERGGEREQVGKSYFRLSPYERKLHRLPASFDEEVFEELSPFMGSKMRTPQGRGVLISAGGSGDSRSPQAAAAMGAKALLPPPPFREEDVSLSGNSTVHCWYLGSI